MNIPSQIPDEDLDMANLTRELDRVKSKVFLGRNAAFLGSLMSSLNFLWSYDIPTAGTDGETFWWNPNDFLMLPPQERASTVEHELWHVARLHMLRGMNKDHEQWNIACDIRINRDLRLDGQHLPPPMWIPDHHEIPFEVEEDIYDFLIKNKIQPPPQGGGNHNHHMVPGGSGNPQKVINNVVKALHQSKIAGEAGSLPGSVHQTIKQFLAPIIPWENLLYQFFNDMLNEEYSWKRPNRRHQEIYLPSRFTDDGRLEHLAYYLDVSGSIQNSDLVRFNSEVKYIKETFNPVKLTLVQFDTRITDEKVILETDQFDEIEIIGRGGTCLVPVREHIIKHKPTAAIIFSDLECAPMQPLLEEIPIIWIGIRARGNTVPFGKLIHIKG